MALVWAAWSHHDDFSIRRFFLSRIDCSFLFLVESPFHRHLDVFCLAHHHNMLAHSFFLLFNIRHRIERAHLVCAENPGWSIVIIIVVVAFSCSSAEMMQKNVGWSFTGAGSSWRPKSFSHRCPPFIRCSVCVAVCASATKKKKKKAEHSKQRKSCVFV